MLRRQIFNLMVGLGVGALIPVEQAHGQEVGELRCVASGNGVRVQGSAQGYNISSGTLVPGKTYRIILDGNTLRIA